MNISEVISYIEDDLEDWRVALPQFLDADEIAECKADIERNEIILAALKAMS